MAHRSFPSILTFDKVKAWVDYQGNAPTLAYGKKIKLHGTNCAVRIEPDGSVSAQGRNEDFSSTHNPDGFLEFVEEKKISWSSLVVPVYPLTFYGEWAGPKIAKGTAIQRTGKKRFFIFALGIGETFDPHRENKPIPEWMITDPETIQSYLDMGLGFDGDDIVVLPWEGDLCQFDFSDETALGRTLEGLNTEIEAIAECDPYVARTFGVEYAGEGLVLVPVSRMAGELSTEYFSRVSFKAKTDKFRVKKQRKAATLKEPLPQTAFEFIETFCTEARLTQALDEVCRGTPDIRKTGDMVSWMTADIEKEGADEIVALDIPFDRLKGEIAAATRAWFIPLTKAA